MIGRRAAAAAAVAFLAAAAPARTERATTDPEPPFIAFRVDRQRLVAVLKVVDTETLRLPETGSTPAAAQYGFPTFALPESWSAHRPALVKAGDRWVIHEGGARRTEAIAEAIVGGDAGCSHVVGVLLDVTGSGAALARSNAKYFIATPAGDESAGRTPPAEESLVLVGPAPPPAAVRGRLGELLQREWPGVRRESEEETARLAASDAAEHRAFAARVRALDRALDRGEVRLEYDVQSWRASASAEPLHFVRAQWFAGARQAFAASVWLRGSSLDVIETNLRAASWLRMWEFQGEIDREHLGLVLNVFTIDGAALFLVAQGGYESMTLHLRRYTDRGFEPTKVGYSYGC